MSLNKTDVFATKQSSNVYFRLGGKRDLRPPFGARRNQRPEKHFCATRLRRDDKIILVFSLGTSSVRTPSYIAPNQGKRDMPTPLWCKEEAERGENIFVSLD